MNQHGESCIGCNTMASVKFQIMTMDQHSVTV